ERFDRRRRRCLIHCSRFIGDAHEWTGMAKGSVAAGGGPGLAGTKPRFMAACRASSAAPRATNSSLNFATKLCTGHEQASPKAQMVRPPGMLSAILIK